MTTDPVDVVAAALREVDLLGTDEAIRADAQTAVTALRNMGLLNDTPQPIRIDADPLHRNGTWRVGGKVPHHIYEQRGPERDTAPWPKGDRPLALFLDPDDALAAVQAVNAVRAGLCGETDVLRENIAGLQQVVRRQRAELDQLRADRTAPATVPFAATSAGRTFADGGD